MTEEGQLKEEEVDVAHAGVKRAAEGSEEEEGAKRAKTEAEDQISLALKKIAAHIGNEKKFSKACGLLTQLLHQPGALQKGHANALFDCAVAAFKDPELPIRDATLRKEFRKLVEDVAARAEVLEPWQISAVAQVYRLVYSLRLQLFTDDSFAFSKIVKDVQAAVEVLPSVSDDDKAQQEAHRVGCKRLFPALAERVRQEADPFDVEGADTGLSLKEIVGARQEAVLLCFEAMREMYQKQWAKATVDLAFQFLLDHRSRFCAVQQDRITKLGAFSKEQKARRRMSGGGPSDIGSVERAAKEWSKQEWISKRGAVGGSKSGGSNYNWLG